MEGKLITGRTCRLEGSFWKTGETKILWERFPAKRVGVGRACARSESVVWDAAEMVGLVMRCFLCSLISLSLPAEAP